VRRRVAKRLHARLADVVGEDLASDVSTEKPSTSMPFNPRAFAEARMLDQTPAPGIGRR